ncbi:MAG: hypothetical protein KBT11_08720 [Treponema sp.]|nr:hypothetical protein [Candidatus Treponema equifaecale]
MNDYTKQDKMRDFAYFKNSYDDLFKKYGHKFFAIKNESVLLACDTPRQVIEGLLPAYKPGTYLLQECNGNVSGYTHTIYGANPLKKRNSRSLKTIRHFFKIGGTIENTNKIFHLKNEEVRGSYKNII